MPSSSHIRVLYGIYLFTTGTYNLSEFLWIFRVQRSYVLSKAMPSCYLAIEQKEIYGMVCSRSIHFACVCTRHSEQQFRFCRLKTSGSFWIMDGNPLSCGNIGQVKKAFNLQTHITVHAVSCHYLMLVLDRFSVKFNTFWANVSNRRDALKTWTVVFPKVSDQ
jgi:hypothetical protein